MKTKFDIFGDPVEMLITSHQVHGAFSIGRQTCKPGGGPPPHIHQHEDEVFSVIAGRFQIFNGESWTDVPENGIAFAPRGHTHCFRNSGDSTGTIQFLCSGNKFDIFLEGLSHYRIPEDLQAMIDYSATYGITYPTLPPPTTKPDLAS